MTQTDNLAYASQPILIIGAGQAGATAATALRKFGYEGPLVLVGNEDVAPYERPPLSKAVLLEAGKDDEIAIHLPQHYNDHGIQVRLDAHIARLDPASHQAILSDGSVLQYSKCLLATGGRARELHGHPVGQCHLLYYIRTLADARALRAQLHALRVASKEAMGTPLVILGAGFLGLEVASTALSLGIPPLIIEPGQRLLARSVPAAFSDWLAQVARVKGAVVRLGVGCNQLREGAQGMELQLSDGAEVLAQSVVAAVGQLANTDLASQAGITVCTQTGGIVIDAKGRTSAADVYAAGDCATQLQPLLDRPVRLESWQSANEQARVAAAAMLGKDTEPTATPWFWTDMFGLNIQMMGLPRADLEYCVRGSLPEPGGLATAGANQPKFLMLGLDERQRLRYALAVNAGGDLRTLRPLFTHDIACQPELLSDGARSLRDSVRQLQATVPHPFH